MHTVIFGVIFVGGIELVVSVSGIGLVFVGRIELVSVVDFVVFVDDFVVFVDNFSSVKMWTESFPPDEIVKN